jgi:hypothetical protein
MSSQSIMKNFIMLPVLLCAALNCGCANVNQRPAGNVDSGTLAIRLTSLKGMEGSARDARIYVDDRFVGHYEPDETELALPVGRHDVLINVPRVYSRRSLGNGTTELRVYVLRGEERIEVLGAGSKQSLVFNDDNLKATEIEVEDGH